YDRALSAAEVQQNYSAGPGNQPPVNQAPTVDAGVDQTITLPAAASLNGSAADDGLPGGSLTTTWTAVSGPGTVTFADAAQVNTTASFSVDGVYVLRLTADDGALTSFDDMTVTVDPAPINQPPTVDAGADQAITLPAAATLDGTILDDGLPSGTLSSTWSAISGPGSVTFGDATAVDTTATFSVDGVYVLRLTADDGALTGFDELTVTVSPALSNQPPVVDAGPDQTVTLPAAASLSGTIADDGLPGGGVTGLWTAISGPGSVTFADATQAITTASFSIDGVYVLRLTADDGALTASDELTVTVNPAPVNQAPTVDAGPDQSINQPAAASLNGTVVDDGLPAGSTLSVLWTQISGPGTTTFANANNAITSATFSATGAYTLRLTADDTALSAFDEVVITVNDSARVVSDLVTLYTFDQGAGSTVSDVSGVGAPLDLTIEDLANTARTTDSGLELSAPTRVSNGVDSSKVYTTPQGNNAISVEAWMVAAQPQGGPARIVTSSTSASQRNFTLGQDNDRIEMRLRTTSNGNNGSNQTLRSAAGSIVPGTLVHVMFTRDATGDARLYLDGVEADAANIGGDFSNWNPLYDFGLGNEFGASSTSATRDWLGELRLVAIYARALSAAEVAQNFNAGDGGQPPVNQAPTADAGPDLTVTLPADATLNGTVSDDGLPLGVTLTSEWSFVSGPGTVTFANANAAVTTASFSTDGTYVLRLTADDTEFTTSDDVTVTVDPIPPNSAPLVDAGPDAVVNLPSAADLNGTVVDDGLPLGGSLVSTWSMVSGPGSVTFADATQPMTTATFSTSGVYTLRLSADDGEFVSSDDVVITAQMSARVTADLLTLYTFELGSGADVFDASGVGSNVDLTVEDPANTTRTASGGLDLTSTTRVSAAAGPGKIYSDLVASNAMTVEAWVVPAQIQGGPARVVTLSANASNRNFTLGQADNRYEVRIRTTTNGNNGTARRLLSAANSAVPGSLVHVVFTRDAGGDARLYLDGVEVDSETIAGDFSNWNPGYDFGLGNEFNSASTNTSRDWLGEFRLVAIFDRALRAAEVAQNFTAGPYARTPTERHGNSG
ncbi:MAG: LamG-like jellyroll fold domain-containing protein, partial [Pseudomonadota bacterium]